MSRSVPMEAEASSSSASSTKPEKIVFRVTQRVAIEESTKLKLFLQDWVAERKEKTASKESYRSRGAAVKAELYQLMGFYTVFQGVVLSAVSNGSKLTCHTAVLPFTLSFLASFGTAVSVRSKLKLFKAERLKFIKAEGGLQETNRRLSKLKYEGEAFDFEDKDVCQHISIEKEKDDEEKAQSMLYYHVLGFLIIFSLVIMVTCFVVSC